MSAPYEKLQIDEEKYKIVYINNRKIVYMNNTSMIKNRKIATVEEHISGDYKLDDVENNDPCIERIRYVQKHNNVQIFKIKGADGYIRWCNYCNYYRSCDNRLASQCVHYNHEFMIVNTWLAKYLVLYNDGNLEYRIPCDECKSIFILTDIDVGYYENKTLCMHIKNKCRWV